MPIYEYHCRQCGSSFEYFMRSKDEKVLCPLCGKSDITKLFSTFACSPTAESATSTSRCSTCYSHNCSQCR